MQAGGPVSDAAAALGLRLVAPDRPGYGYSSFAPYRVVDYPAMLARFADALGIERFGVLGTSGGGRYAHACAVALPDRVTRVALVASTAPANLPGVPETWSRADRRLYTTAKMAPWLLRLLLARTSRRFRRQPDRMLGMVPDLSVADERALASPDVQALVTTNPRATAASVRTTGHAAMSTAYRLPVSRDEYGIPFTGHAATSAFSVVPT